MNVDIPIVLARIKTVLPARWFADETPVLDALLTGLASAWVELFDLLNIVRAQGRIATASAIFLDIAASDYFGTVLPRRIAESDRSYSARIQKNLLRPRTTRASVIQILKDLTGRVPKIFEPRNPDDTGAYGAYLGYGLMGGYGSMNMPYQFLVNAYRPNNLPVGNASGYVTGPGGYGIAPAYFADTSQFQGHIDDAEIYSCIVSVVPTSCVAWTNISN